MKKLLIAFSLIALLTGCESSIDKDKHPEGGLVVFIGFDKSLYFVVDDENDISYSSSYGSVEITYDKNKPPFRTNDTYYKYPFYDKKELNELLKQFNHKEID